MGTRQQTNHEIHRADRSAKSAVRQSAERRAAGLAPPVFLVAVDSASRTNFRHVKPCLDGLFPGRVRLAVRAGGDLCELNNLRANNNQDQFRAGACCGIKVSKIVRLPLFVEGNFE